MGLFERGKEKILLEGLMPERALLRLRRAGIAVYNVQKIKKNRIVFLIKKKDSEKVFAIYPNLCYNVSVNGAYQVKSLGAVGVGKLIENARKRMGLLLGALLCLAVVLATQPLTLAVEFVGTNVYEREVYQALGKAGFGKFKPYKTGKEDLICSQILALDNVEFCSVKKQGYRLIVEVQTSPFPKREIDTGVMRAKHDGVIVAITTLRGTALKKIGERVQTGETLVDNRFEGLDGGQVRVEIIARVRIACAYETEIQAQSPEEAFANAYLDLQISDKEQIRNTEIQESEKGYLVKIEYDAVETLNF